ncbi:hypothetical protein DAEQUDRAFT_758667 [Daedalea quercina L-15889]|uniref:Uncharacterized protein n=1 Tax=Daedalea quercina L-15889 TaxID=1314783 RepID=A0A165N5M4_9APHY|nr:hypothetical protein DAEQUDRAFT_758667 [Daedalea quercina L-15889]
MRTFTLTILALAAAMVSPVIGAPINSVQVQHIHSEHVPVQHQHPPSSHAVSEPEGSDAVEGSRGAWHRGTNFVNANAARNMPDADLVRRETVLQELAKCMSTKTVLEPAGLQECMKKFQA